MRLCRLLLRCGGTLVFVCSPSENRRGLITIFYIFGNIFVGVYGFCFIFFEIAKNA